MQPQAARMSGLSRDDLIDTRWTFGARGLAPLTTGFRFGASGDILDYRHDNENSWRLNDGALEIYHRSGHLMWTSGRAFEQDEGRRYLTLKTPFNAECEFVLCEYRRPTALDFLFPTQLRVTPTLLQRILLIGSCLTTRYLEELSLWQPEVTFDRILFNFAADFPDAPPAPVSTYDFQYVQIPLRSVIGDRIVSATCFNEPGFGDQVLREGMNVIDVMLAAAMRYNQAHGLLTFVSNFMVPQMGAPPALRSRGRAADLAYIVRRLNDHLADSVTKFSNAYLMDVDALADSIGKRYIMDDVMFFYSHGAVQIQLEIDPTADSRVEPVPPITQFYQSKADTFVQAVYEQMLATYRTVRQIDQVKAVVFDLDHTLWRGQLAEHYRADASDSWPAADGWPMGLWEAIQHLRARGILVAICSKNDRATVERDWANAVRPGFISLADFSSIKINWQPKADNIRAICEEFNLKPKSVVFVDDNPVERAAVKAALPDIRVIGANPLLSRRILLWAAETQVAMLTDESLRREDMIRRQAVREETRAVMSREQFLASLATRISFARIEANTHPDFGRSLELINKTNQFNTTGRRWSHAEVSQFCAEGGMLLAFRVNDRFADYGLVGVVLTIGARIEQLVMSCRVLGMEIEQAAIAHVASLIRQQGATGISARLVETADNLPCREVYTKCGFSASPTSAQGGCFVLKGDALPRLPAHIRLESR